MTPETKKRLPDVIYIIDPYDENGDLVTNTEDVCWCQDAVGDENVAYVSRVAIAAALAELWAQAEAGAEKWFGHHNEANIYQDFADSILTTITKLGLEGTK